MRSEADMRGALGHVRFGPIVLRKSVAAGGFPSAIRLLTTGFDLPSLTQVTQLPRYAMHRALAGGGRATSAASLLRFWAMAARTNSSWASGAAQSKPVEPQDAFELRKSHLDLLALASRLFETHRANERPGDVAGALMDIARDLA